MSQSTVSFGAQPIRCSRMIKMAPLNIVVNARTKTSPRSVMSLLNAATYMMIGELVIQKTGKTHTW